MAAIRKRANGKYEVQVRRKGQAPVSRSFHLRSDAEQWARHMETKADRGDLPVSVKVLDAHTIKDILIRYRDEVTIKKRSADTETYLLNAFLREPLANLTLAQITSAHFGTYRDKRLKEVKPGTVNRELSIIKHALDIAGREWGVPLRENPLANLKKLRVNNARTRRLAEGEFEALQDAAVQSRNDEIVPLIRFALATAMRRGEILRLCWGDIDLKNKTLHIPITKNGYARTIPLSQEALDVLVGLMSDQPEKQDAVFDFSDNAAKLAWQRLVKRAGIDDLHFHDLRHEAVSRFFERGLSVPEVALISGHRDFRMLARYTHMKAEDIAKKLNG